MNSGTKPTLKIAQSMLLPVVFACSSTAIAGEFGGQCAMALAQGEHIETDCSINWDNPKDRKTYCFSTARSKFMFMQGAKTFIARAAEEYNRK